MSCGKGTIRRWRSAGLLALVAYACPGAALAADPEADRPSPSHVLFGSLDAGPAKILIAQGAKLVLGPGSLSTSGFRALVSTGQSVETLRQDKTGGVLHKAEVQGLLGFEWRLRRGSFAVYAGPDVQAERWANDPVFHRRIGQRLHVDLWYAAGADWTIQASAYAATLDRRLWLRLAPGWALPWRGRFGRPTLGPEIELYRQQGYDKIRLGLHLAGLRLFKLNWRLSFGWERASGDRSHAYATLGVYGHR